MARIAFRASINNLGMYVITFIRIVNSFLCLYVCGVLCCLGSCLDNLTMSNKLICSFHLCNSVVIYRNNTFSQNGIG